MKLLLLLSTVQFTGKTMQESLNFPTTTRKPLIPFSTSSFPSKSSTFPSLSLPKSANFPTLSSKSTTATTTTTLPTIPLPPKPPKTPILPSIPPSTSNDHLNHPPQSVTPTISTTDPDPDQDFHSKALFLDSIGLDSLSLLTDSNSSSLSLLSSTSLSDLKSLFTYLLDIPFNPQDLRRIIAMCPQILSLHPSSIAPVFAFLLREVHLPASRLSYAIRRRPHLLLSPVETRLRPTLYFLQSIGIHEVHHHTNLLSCSVEDKFIPKIEYFEKLGFSYRDAVSMFRRFPALFCYSVKDNFEPKFNYFVIEMGRDLRELKEFPQYFSFSLENRIKPRHQSCVENGVCFPLNVMLKMKEEVFRQRLDAACNSSMPRSTSPLWCANHCDVNKLL